MQEYIHRSTVFAKVFSRKAIKSLASLWNHNMKTVLYHQKVGIVFIHCPCITFS